jgi:hypothetical protein
MVVQSVVCSREVEEIQSRQMSEARGEKLLTMNNRRRSVRLQQQQPINPQWEALKIKQKNSIEDLLQNHHQRRQQFEQVLKEELRQMNLQLHKQSNRFINNKQQHMQVLEQQLQQENERVQQDYQRLLQGTQDLRQQEVQLHAGQEQLRHDQQQVRLVQQQLRADQQKLHTDQQKLLADQQELREQLLPRRGRRKN